MISEIAKEKKKIRLQEYYTFNFHSFISGINFNAIYECLKF